MRGSSPLENLFVFSLLISAASFVGINFFLGSAVLEYVGKVFGNFGLGVLYNLKFVGVMSTLYFLLFTALQSATSRERRTLFNTRIFGMIVVVILGSFASLVFVVGSWLMVKGEGVMGWGGEGGEIAIGDIVLARLATCQIIFGTLFSLVCFAGSLLMLKH